MNGGGWQGQRGNGTAVDGKVLENSGGRGRGCYRQGAKAAGRVFFPWYIRPIARIGQKLLKAFLRVEAL